MNSRNGLYNVWDAKKQKYVSGVGAISRARWIIGPLAAGISARRHPNFDKKVHK